MAGGDGRRQPDVAGSANPTHSFGMSGCLCARHRRRPCITAVMWGLSSTLPHGDRRPPVQLGSAPTSWWSRERSGVDAASSYRAAVVPSLGFVPDQRSQPLDSSAIRFLAMEWKEEEVKEKEEAKLQLQWTGLGCYWSTRARGRRGRRGGRNGFLGLPLGLRGSDSRLRVRV